MGKFTKIEAFDPNNALESLVRRARDHAVFCNPFYLLWKSKRLRPEQFNVF